MPDRPFSTQLIDWFLVFASLSLAYFVLFPMLLCLPFAFSICFLTFLSCDLLWIPCLAFCLSSCLLWPSVVLLCLFLAAFQSSFTSCIASLFFPLSLGLIQAYFFPESLGNIQVENCDRFPFFSQRSGCQHFIQNTSQFQSQLYPQPRLLKMNIQELQAQDKLLVHFLKCVSQLHRFPSLRLLVFSRCYSCR